MLPGTERRRKKRRQKGLKHRSERQEQVHLSELRPGETGRILSFHGGKGFREKMSGMGLFPGIDIEVVQTDGEEGMMLICVGGTRLMLCRRMAGRVHLERTD